MYSVTIALVLTGLLAAQEPTEASPALKTAHVKLETFGPADFDRLGIPLLEKLRSESTPALGTIEFDAPSNSIRMTDTERRVATLTKIIRDADSVRAEIFLDVKVVTRRVREHATQHESLAKGIRTLSSAQTDATLRQLRDEAGASVLQLPKLIARDRRTAELRMGKDADSPDVLLKIVPSILEDGIALTLDIDARLAAVDPIATSTLLAIRSGETAVVLHGRPQDGYESLLFVTPNVVVPRIGDSARPKRE